MVTKFYRGWAYRVMPQGTAWAWEHTLPFGGMAKGTEQTRRGARRAARRYMRTRYGSIG